MEHYKISKLLNDSNIPKSATKKWIEINDLSSGQYSVNKNVRFKASMLRSDLYDYSGAYFDVKKRISITGTDNANRKNDAFNDAPFRSCIPKINSTFVDNAEDINIVVPMYNLLENSDNYSMTSGSLWNYYRDDANDSAVKNIRQK